MLHVFQLVQPSDLNFIQDESISKQVNTLCNGSSDSECVQSKADHAQLLYHPT